MKKFFVVLFLLSGVFCFGQNLNNYKYVLVPDRFDFQKSADQHQINSLTKFLFNKYGFEAYLKSDEKPLDYKEFGDGCNVLKANVVADGGFINTKTKVSLSNCSGEILYASPEGRSKNKDFKKAYHEALRISFESIAALQYSYNSNKKDNNEPEVSVSEEPIVVAQDIKKKPSKTIVIEKPADVKVTVEEVKKDTIILSAESRSTPQVLEDPMDGIKNGKQKKSEAIYESKNSNYRVVLYDGVYNIFDKNKNIGKAAKASGNMFLIKTSDFDGVGRLEGNQFIIEREIKGVEGLVKMIFEKQ